MNVGACYCRTVSARIKQHCSLQLGRVPSSPQRLKSRGFAFLLSHSFPCHMHVKEPDPGTHYCPLPMVIMIIIVVDFKLCSQSSLQWMGCKFLQERVHLAFGNCYLLEERICWWRWRRGSGWAEIRQRWESCKQGGDAFSLPCSSPMGSVLLSLRKEPGPAWGRQWNIRLQLLSRWTWDTCNNNVKSSP